MNLVFDIDDTVLKCDYINGKYYLKGFDPDLVELINQLYIEGVGIVFQTARHWNHLKDTEDQLKQLGIKYNTLVMGKPVADLYIDDRAMRPEEFVKLYKTKYGGKKWQMI